jgi:hypothetical protein
MSSQYYYFVSGLPRITVDDTKLTTSPQQFLEQAETQLGAADALLLKFMRLDADLDTLLDVLYKQDGEQRPLGAYPRQWWEGFPGVVNQKLENRDFTIPAPYDEVPAFVAQSIGTAMSAEEFPSRLALKHELLQGLYSEAADSANGFVREWYQHERLMRNILLAINGRKHELDYSPWLIGDDEITQKLATSKATDFGIGKDLELWEALNRAYEQNNVLYRERAYDVIRWKWIDSRNFFQYFNIDKVLGYYVQLCILSRWLELSVEAGGEVFFDTLNKLQNSFSFPAEFNIKQKNK